MGSFDHYIIRLQLFIFLNERTTYLEENLQFFKISNGSIFLFCPGGQNKVLKLTDRKMNRARFLKRFWKHLICGSNPYKFYIDVIIFDRVVAIFSFCLNLTPKRFFDPCDPPGGSGPKIFYPGISLGVTHHLSPKWTQNSILYLTVLIQIIGSAHVKALSLTSWRSLLNYI